MTLDVVCVWCWVALDMVGSSRYSVLWVVGVVVVVVGVVAVDVVYGWC